MMIRNIRWGRRSAVTLLALAAAGALTACAGTSTPGGKGAAAASDPSGTLNIAVSSAPGSDAGFAAVDKAFEAKYPKVKVVLSSIPNDNYSAVRSSRMTAGNVDIAIADPRQLPSYVPASNEADDARLAEAGGFVDLTQQPFMKAYTPTVLQAIAFQGKQYTVPTGLSYETGVFYNKALFAKYHLAIPTTWAQFLQVCQTLKSNGVAPLGIGGKDSWPAGLNMLATVQGLYPTADDKANLNKALWTKTTTLTDATQAEVLQRTQAMYANAQPNFAGVPYSAIPSGFVKGQFAMTVDGTWDEPAIAAAAGSSFSYGYFPLPSSDNAQDNAYLGGKVELMLGIPSNSKHISTALAYLKFFSDPTNYQTFVKLAGFAPSQPNITLSDFLTSIQKYTSVFSPAWDTIWFPNPKAGPKAQFPFDYTDLAPLGKSNATQAAANAQHDWAAGL